ncbi:MAG: hypothetical protein JNM27_13415 [Leptospirales bacterium]|nr:hypothetical protein [Leptospirales bacterium]
MKSFRSQLSLLLLLTVTCCTVRDIDPSAARRIFELTGPQTREVRYEIGASTIESIRKEYENIKARIVASEPRLDPAKFAFKMEIRKHTATSMHDSSVSTIIIIIRVLGPKGDVLDRSYDLLRDEVNLRLAPSQTRLVPFQHATNFMIK